MLRMKEPMGNSVESGAGNIISRVAACRTTAQTDTMHQAVQTAAVVWMTNLLGHHDIRTPLSRGILASIMR